MSGGKPLALPMNAAYRSAKLRGGGFFFFVRALGGLRVLLTDFTSTSVPSGKARGLFQQYFAVLHFATNGHVHASS
jgi:hypothetical protein